MKARDILQEFRASGIPVRVAADEATRCKRGGAIPCPYERAPGAVKCPRHLAQARASQRRHRGASTFVEKPSKCAKGGVPAEVRAQLADPRLLPKRPPGRST